MATYKVIQDIEAEDKLLGPLTLRQFIYGAVAALCGYFCFLGVAKHFIPLTIIFLPIMLLFGFFAFPWGRDQPTEVWALAKVRFLLLPRRRIWDQSGVKELVTVTAPKKIDTNYTNNLSQTEVKSRLQALADTLDSRGWVVKNVDPASAAATAAAAAQSDRLVNIASLPQEVADNPLTPQDDVMDENGRTAANFDQMINAAEANHHQQLVNQMQASNNAPPQAPAERQPAAPPDNFWFLNQPAGGTPIAENVITPGSEATAVNSGNIAGDVVLAEQIKANKKTPQITNMHLRTIQPPSDQNPIATPTEPPTDNYPTNNYAAADDSVIGAAPQQPNQPPKADYTQTDDDKIERARRAARQAQLASNDDLSIATIARQAKEPASNEVVISLH